MKRFRFPLQPVVVLRAHGELRAREVLGAAMVSLARAEEHLAATRSRVARFAATLANGRRELFSGAAEAQSLAAYRRECVAETEAERTTTAAHATMVQRRVEYVDAHRRLEIVHRLEGKARAAHQVSVNREEQAEFDDLAGRQATLRSRSSL